MIRTPLQRKTPLKATTSKGGGKRKASRPKMTEARNAAKGKPCMIRIPGVCNGDPATVVLCHYRLAGYCGMGLKPDDDLAAWGCSACHACVDGRAYAPGGLTYDEVRLAHAEGVLRTQMARRPA